MINSNGSDNWHWPTVLSCVAGASAILFIAVQGEIPKTMSGLVLAVMLVLLTASAAGEGVHLVITAAIAFGLVFSAIVERPALTLAVTFTLAIVALARQGPNSRLQQLADWSVVVVVFLVLVLVLVT